MKLSNKDQELGFIAFSFDVLWAYMEFKEKVPYQNRVNFDRFGYSFNNLDREIPLTIRIIDL